MIDSSWEGTETEYRNVQITREMINRWTDCLHDNHPVYTDRETSLRHGYNDVLVPPTFPAVFWNDFSLPWMKQGETVIHEKQTFTYHTPITAGMTVKMWITLNEVKHIQLPSGRFQRLRQTLSGEEVGKLVFEAVMTTLIPVEHEYTQTIKKQKNARPLLEESNSTALFSIDWLKQYAACSKDRQAIHLDENAARQAGFSRQIVHGMLLMGVAAHLFHKKIDQGYHVTSFDMRFLSPVHRNEKVYFYSKNQKPATSAMKIKGLNQDGFLIFTGTIQ